MIFNLPRKINFSLIVLIFLAISCKEKTENDSNIDTPNNSPTEIQRQPTYRQKPNTNLSHSDSNDSQISSDYDRQKIIEKSTFIIDHGDRTPGSADAEELRIMIIKLLSRGDQAAYDILSKLPPGYYSEAIVKGVFLNLEFDSIDSITNLTSSISHDDLRIAAISAACSAFVLKSKRIPNPPQVTKAQALSLKESGLPRNEYESLLIHGLRAGSITPEEILPEISTDRNTMLSGALMNSPIDTSKNLLVLAINNEKSVDLASVKNFAVRLLRENPVQAVEWFLDLPNDKLVAAGIGSIMNEWLAADPIAASSFVGTMSQGAGKDAAVSRVVHDCIKNGDYATGTKWLEHIQSDELKSELLKSLNNIR